jgi:TRAP-type C4-dicarboxylate transport system permease small subunit
MNIKRKVDRILEVTLSTIMGIMVVNVLWQVFSRYVLGAPSSFTDELARYLMIWLGILGAAYVSGRNMHVAIELFQSDSGKRVVKILIIIFALTAFIAGGSRLVYITFILEQFSPALKIPLAVVYLVIPLSGILIVFYKTVDLVKMK